MKYIKLWDIIVKLKQINYSIFIKVFSGAVFNIKSVLRWFKIGFVCYYVSKLNYRTFKIDIFKNNIIVDVLVSKNLYNLI
jgi:hypothetical protein